MLLNARKGKVDANVSLRHSVKVDTSMKAPVHHRRNIEVTFLSPLMLFGAWPATPPGASAAACGRCCRKAERAARGANALQPPRLPPSQ